MGRPVKEGDQAHDQDGPERVGKAVVQRDGAADGLQRQKGHAAQGCVGHAQLTPFACTLGRVAQRVVLQRLVGYPGVVVAADAKDLLWCVVHACAFWCMHCQYQCTRKNRTQRCAQPAYVN